MVKLTKESIIYEIGDDFQLKLDISFKLSHWHWAFIGYLSHCQATNANVSLRIAQTRHSPRYS